MVHSPMIDFFEKIPMLSVLLSNNADLTILEMNDRFKRVFNLSRDEDLENYSFMEFISRDDQDKFQRFVSMAGKSEQGYQWEKFTITSRDLNSKEILLKYVDYFENTETYNQITLLGLPIDEINFEDYISSQRNNVEKFENQSNKYLGIIENANVGIAIFNERGYLEETNPTFAKHIGRQREELRNQHFCNLLESNIKGELRRLFRKIDKGDQGLIKEVLRINHDNNYVNILEFTISKVIDNSKAQNKYLLISQDITDQQETHAALIKSEKLALTGRLAASLAHEINNPLQTSIGCLGLAEEILDEKNEELRVYLEMAMQELKRSSRIVKKLRDLNRRVDPSEKSAISLEEILQGLLLLTQNRMDDRNIQSMIENEATSKMIVASKDQIHQVFLNLVMNAIDAMPEGGKILLSLKNTKKPDGITITIRDTGHGMTPEVLNNLFDPFFTTKEDGLGLGLYICKQIIEDHEGKLEVESQFGKGTAFSIWLPQNLNIESE